MPVSYRIASLADHMAESMRLTRQVVLLTRGWWPHPPHINLAALHGSSCSMRQSTLAIERPDPSTFHRHVPASFIRSHSRGQTVPPGHPWHWLRIEKGPAPGRTICRQMS